MAAGIGQIKGTGQNVSLSALHAKGPQVLQRANSCPGTLACSNCASSRTDDIDEGVNGGTRDHYLLTAMDDARLEGSLDYLEPRVWVQTRLGLAAVMDMRASCCSSGSVYLDEES